MAKGDKAAQAGGSAQAEQSAAEKTETAQRAIEKAVSEQVGLQVRPAVKDAVQEAIEAVLEKDSKRWDELFEQHRAEAMAQLEADQARWGIEKGKAGKAPVDEGAQYESEDTHDSDSAPPSPVTAEEVFAMSREEFERAKRLREAKLAKIAEKRRLESTKGTGSGSGTRTKRKDARDKPRGEPPSGPPAEDDSSAMALLGNFGFGRKSPPRGPFSLASHAASRDKAERADGTIPTLVPWEAMGLVAASMPDLPMLGGFTGGREVADVLNDLVELCQKAIDQAVNIAEGTWDVVGNSTNVRTATPNAATGAKSYSELQDRLLSLTDLINDSSTINETAKRSDASGRPLPSSILIAAFEVIKFSSEFACAFDSASWSQRQMCSEDLKSHDKWFRNFLDHYPRKFHARRSYERLVEVSTNLMLHASGSAAKGSQRAMTIARQKVIMQSANPQPARQQRSDAGKKRAHEDDARGAFQHNPNPPQDKSAANQRKQSPADHKKNLLNLPSGEGIRKAAIREGLCKFHWMPEFTCTRGSDCPFAHLSVADTKRAGISSEEIEAVFSKI